MLSEEMFKNRISIDNPWWQTGCIDQEYRDVSPRIFLDTLYRHLLMDGLRRAIVLMGPRRVGKTWLLQHAINKLLLEQNVKPQNIIFLPIDVPVYHNSELEELVYAASKISGANPRTDRMYVFFDEIQYRKNWETSLKTLTDSYSNIKFVASGSAASVLLKGARESGAGRFTDLTLTPLTFYEYVGMIGQDENILESIDQTNRMFLDYVNFGGYPELVANANVRNNAKQFIRRDIVDKVLLRDLPSLYHIDDVRDLQAFFSYVAYHSGMVQSYEGLSQGTGISKHTVSKLVQYLEDSFLIAKLDRVDINALSLKRATQFKLYLTNPSLRASMFQAVKSNEDQNFGYVIETAVAAQLGIEDLRQDWRYANWRVSKKQGELDFVKIDAGRQKPIEAFEVKWSDGPFDHPAELNEAVKFAQSNGLNKITVTSKTEKGTKYVDNVELSFIPTAHFAYNLGKTLLSK